MRGTLTGTRCAGVLGRICVESVLKEVVADIKPLAFPIRIDDFVAHNSKTGFLLPRHEHLITPTHMICTTWIDNIYVYAESADNATTMLDILEQKLKCKWNLHFKTKSKQVLAGGYTPP
eukprot:2999754-Karenia_brevis.AAC.1